MTTTAPIPTRTPTPVGGIRYGALIVVMLLSFLLVTAEFLPNGVLIEMADGLGITPGQAGQTVTVTALVGLVVAPTVGLVFPRLDRRSLLFWMALAAAASNLIVAIAPNLVIVLLARFLLGAPHLTPGTEIAPTITPDGLAFLATVDGRVHSLVSLAVAGERVTEVYIVRNPDKLTLWR